MELSPRCITSTKPGLKMPTLRPYHLFLNQVILIKKLVFKTFRDGPDGTNTPESSNTIYFKTLMISSSNQLLELILFKEKPAMERTNIQMDITFSIKI